MSFFDLMIFDLDGTLVDSAQDLIAAVNHTRLVLGLKTLNDREIISFVGDGTDKLVERFVGEEGRDRREEAMEIFLGYYEEHLLDNTRLYPGVSEVLDFFKSVKKAIITNKNYRFTRKITDGLGITGCFADIIGMGSTAYRKPDGRILLPILERFQADPSRTIVFGDGVTDVNLAKNAGVMSCAVLYGFTHRDVLMALKPDFTCESMTELKAMFS